MLPHTGSWPQRPLGAVVAAIFPGLPTGRRGAARAPVTERLLTLRDLTQRSTPERGSLPPVAVPGPPERLERYRVRALDVLLSCRGTQLRVARVTAAGAGAVATSNLLVVRPGPLLHPALVFALLQCPHNQALLRRRSRAAGEGLALYAADLQGLQVPVPPEGLQRRLAELVETAEEQHRLAQRAADLRLRLCESVARAVLFGAAGGEVLG